MKRRMKRMAAAILAATMVLSCFSGCGKNGTGGSKGGKEDPIVIDWYMMMPTTSMQTEDIEMVEKAANEIIYPQTGCMLDFHFYDRATYTEKMRVMLTTGEKVDIVFLSGSGSFGSKAYLDISGMLEEYAPDILEKVDDIAWQAVTVDGAIRAIPGQNSWSRTWGWALKKDLVEKYNFDYQNVHSLEDLEPFLEAVKNGESGITPILMTKTGMLSAPGQQTWCNQIAGCIVYDTNAGKFVRQLVDNEETISRYKLMWKWYQKGYIAKDALALDSYQSEAKTGKYAVLNNVGSYDATGVKSTNYYGFETVEIFTGLTKNIDASGVAVVSNAIASTCPHPEKALEVLNLVWKDPNLSNLLAYGIEGVHYVVNEERSAEIGSRSIIPDSGSDITYMVAHNWLGPLWDQWDSTWNSLEALEELKGINEMVKAQGTLPECFGFTFDSKGYETQVASVAAVMSASKIVLETGSSPDVDAYLKEVNQRLTKAGIDILLEEVNRQYEEWLKTK